MMTTTRFYIRIHVVGRSVDLKERRRRRRWQLSQHLYVFGDCLGCLLGEHTQHWRVRECVCLRVILVIASRITGNKSTQTTTTIFQCCWRSVKCCCFECCLAFYSKTGVRIVIWFLCCCFITNFGFAVSKMKTRQLICRTNVWCCCSYYNFPRFSCLLF